MRPEDGEQGPWREGTQRQAGLNAAGLSSHSECLQSRGGFQAGEAGYDSDGGPRGSKRGVRGPVRRLLQAQGAQVRFGRRLCGNEGEKLTDLGNILRVKPSGVIEKFSTEGKEAQCIFYPPAITKLLVVCFTHVLQ